MGKKVRKLGRGMGKRSKKRKVKIVKKMHDDNAGEDVVSSMHQYTFVTLVATD